MSPVFVMRRARGNANAASDAGVLAGKLYRQALASFLPTAAQNFTSPLRGHARAKSVCADAALVAGTIRWLTHSDSKLGLARVFVTAKERKPIRG